MWGRTYVCVFVRVFMCQRRGECCGVCVRETERERVCCELPEDLSEQWCVTERTRERFGAQRGREWAIEPQSEIIFFKKGRERGKDLEPSEKVKEKLIEKQKKGKDRVMPREKRERGRLRLTDNAVICVWLGWIYWIRQALNSSLSFCLSVSLSLILSLSQSYVLRLITFLEYVSCYPEIITSEGEDILGWFTLSWNTNFWWSHRRHRAQFGFLCLKLTLRSNWHYQAQWILEDPPSAVSWTKKPRKTPVSLSQHFPAFLLCCHQLQAQCSLLKG